MNSPQKRNLTDELQSVLRAHSLEAPEPSGSIDHILARTVGVEAQLPVTSEKARRRWFAPNRVMLASVGAAAVVAALVSLPIVLAANHTSRSHTANSERATAAFDTQSGKNASSAGQVPPSVLNALPGAGMAADAAQPPPCAPEQLALSLVTDGVVAPTVAQVKVTNVSASSCLVSGFPTVRPVRSGSSLAYDAANPVATNGAQAESVPTLVLAPNTSATAAVDAGSALSDCKVTSLAVTLPGSRQVVELPFTSSSCGFEVHPLTPAQK